MKAKVTCEVSASWNWLPLKNVCTTGVRAKAASMAKKPATTSEPSARPSQPRISARVRAGTGERPSADEAAARARLGIRRIASGVMARAHFTIQIAASHFQLR